MTENILEAMNWEMVEEATKKDPKMKMLLEEIQAGQCRNTLPAYTKVFEELSEVGGLVMRGEKLVLPKKLQPSAIQLPMRDTWARRRPWGC